MFCANSQIQIRKGAKIYTDTAKNLGMNNKASLLTIIGRYGNHRFEYYSIETINITKVEEVTMYKLTFESTKGVIRTLLVDKNTQVHTLMRNFCNLGRLNSLDIIMDEEGYLNKLVSCEPVVMNDIELADISLKYKNGWFCNGIMIK
jgi:hypothetical protein